MASHAVKLPDEPRVRLECLGRRERGCFVVPPHASCPTKGWQPAGGREACAAEGHYAPAGEEVSMKGCEVCSGRHFSFSGFASTGGRGGRGGLCGAEGRGDEALLGVESCGGVGLG